MNATIKLPEAAVLSQVKDYMKLHGIFFFRVHQSLGSTPGIPDLVAIAPKTGKLMAIEVKATDGKLSPIQGEFLRCVALSGGIVAVVRSWEDIKAVFEKPCSTAFCGDSLREIKEAIERGKIDLVKNYKKSLTKSFARRIK